MALAPVLAPVLVLVLMPVLVGVISGAGRCPCHRVGRAVQAGGREVKVLGTQCVYRRKMTTRRKMTWA